MGKPFNQELTKIKDVLGWASDVDVFRLRRFLLHERSHCVVVGSGGSISASFLLAELLQTLGRTCQVVTPFELYNNQQILADSQVILISASGKNKDILFAFKTALSQEPRSIGCLTMTLDSPLAKLASAYSICELFEFAIPTRKDGFLATNSLVATWTLLIKAVQGEDEKPNIAEIAEADSSSKQFLVANPGITTLVVLYGKWGKPVAVDIESKSTEAGLVTTQLADFRNFGHGRHHWLAKHPDSTAIVSIIAEEDTVLCEATLSVLPSSIPKLVIKSTKTGFNIYVDLLVKSFSLIKSLGEMTGIDPGRPGVPEFGRLLYHLNPKKYLDLPRQSTQQLAVRRKLRSFIPNAIPSLDAVESLNVAFESFSKKIKSTKFGSIILDYDGTIGSKVDKNSPLSEEIVKALVTHLDKGFILGIATGRGKSASQSLRAILPPEFWHQVVIGYYNGTVIYPLTEDLPAMINTPKPVLLKVLGYLDQLSHLRFETEVRAYQITIQTVNEYDKLLIYNLIQSHLVSNHIYDVSLFTSGHCIDVIYTNDGSKTNVINACKQLADQHQLSLECLCIGDQGKFPGNDFTMLATPFSLSVDEVSPQLNSCWHIASIGQRNVSAMIEYVRSISYHLSYFKFKIAE